MPAASSASPVPVVGAPAGTVVQIAPGQKIVHLPAEAVPPLVVAEAVATGGGHFRLVGRVMPRWFSYNKKNLRLLGITFSETTMLRLMVAGFVENRRPGPNVREFSYDSYLAHAEATRDPEFWDQTQPGQKFTNLQRYQQANL